MPNQPWCDDHLMMALPQSNDIEKWKKNSSFVWQWPFRFWIICRQDRTFSPFVQTTKRTEFFMASHGKWHIQHTTFGFYIFLCLNLYILEWNHVPESIETTNAMSVHNAIIYAHNAGIFNVGLWFWYVGLCDACINDGDYHLLITLGTRLHKNCGDLGNNNREKKKKINIQQKFIKQIAAWIK